MTRFLAARGLTPADALFAGDSQTDMQQAALAGIPFVGIGTPEFFAEGAPLAVVPSLPDRRGPHRRVTRRDQTGTEIPERGAERMSRSHPRSACSTWARWSAR